MKDKILMIAATPFFSDRGCHIRIYNEMKYLAESGHEVKLCTYHNGKDVGGLEVKRIGNVSWYKKTTPGASIFKPYLDVKLFFVAIKSYWKFKPTLLHAHLYEGLTVAFLVKIFTFSRVPIVFDFQGSLAEELYAYNFKKHVILRPLYYLFFLLEKALLYIPNSIVSSSQNGAQVLQKSFHIKKSKVTLVKDGFDTSLLRQNQDALSVALKHDLYIPLSNKVVVYSGSLTEGKGVREYLDYIPNLLVGRDNITFLFVGYGDLQKEYEKKYASYIKDKKIIFTGRVSYFDLPKYLFIADFAVDPKRLGSESSAKIMSYLQQGIPTACFFAPIVELSPYVYLISSFSELGAFLDQRVYRTNLPAEILQKYSVSSSLKPLLEVYQNQKGNGHLSHFYQIFFVSVVSIICIIIFSKYSSISVLASILQQANLRFLALSFLIYLFISWLRAFRYCLISPLKSVTDNFMVSSIHTFINNVLPAETGEAAYPYLLKKIHDVSYTKSVSDLLVVRIFDFANVFLFLIAGLLVFWHFERISVLVFFVIGQLLIVATFMFLVKKVRGFVMIDKAGQSILAKIKNFIGQILEHQSFHSFGKLLIVHLFSFFITFLMLLYSYFLMKSLGLHILPQLFIIGWCASLFGSLLPIQGFFSFGSTEVGWFFPLVAGGLTQARAIAISVNYHILSLLFSFVIFIFAAVYLFAKRQYNNRQNNIYSTDQK